MPGYSRGDLMNKTEGVALVLVLLVMIGLPLAAYNYQTWKTASSTVGIIEIEAWTVENGGWNPRRVAVSEGEASVNVVLRSMDTAHSLVIPELGVDSGILKPGEPITLELRTLEYGVYQFYCGVWCSPEHGEMRGTLVIVEAGP